VNVLTRFRQVRHHWALHLTRRSVMIAAAILASVAVSTLTIDLGPAARKYAEEYGTKGLRGRPVHIGRLSLKILSGHVIVENFSIEGLKPDDRPFFRAATLDVTLDWATLAHREVTIGTVEMTDWEMLVERWEDHVSFPKFGSGEDQDSSKPRKWTATVKWLHAYRGQFTYDDHERPWSAVARNIDLTVANPPAYTGEATFTGGTVTIQDFVPMWANMHARFRIDKGRVHLDRIDLDTDGATSVATGDVDFTNWPEQTYQVKSRVRFPRMREIFFGHETWRVTGDGDFTGVFHLFKGGHDLHGTFTSPIAAVND